MTFFMSRFKEETYALMRFFTGALFLWHGTQKLFHFPKEPFPLPAWQNYGAGGIELVTGVLVAIGLFTRPAAFVASGCMAVAYWMVHSPNKIFPVLDHLPLLNRGELAALYCFVFLFISARGGGIWSVDGNR